MKTASLRKCLILLSVLLWIPAVFLPGMAEDGLAQKVEAAEASALSITAADSSNPMAFRPGYAMRSSRYQQKKKKKKRCRPFMSRSPANCFIRL